MSRLYVWPATSAQVMKSSKQKKGGCRGKVESGQRSTAAAGDVSAKPVMKDDLATVQSAQQQTSFTAEKPSDGAETPLELEQYQKHWGALTVVISAFHLRHLSRLYQEFGGDLVLPVILGEIEHYNVMQFFSNEGYAKNPQEIPNDLAASPLLRPCHAFSISGATGIPRETVRRKVAKLIAMGWIRRDSYGHLFITEKPYKHFMSKFNRESLKELRYVSTCVQSILDND
jgi:hypothetical protein